MTDASSGRRFSVPEGTLDAPTALLGPELTHRIAHVLRLGPGARIRLFDGTGREALAEVTAVSRASATVRVISLHRPMTEPSVRVTLCQSLLPSDRFHWVLEKGTELGVAAFVPLLTSRCTARAEPSGPAAERKLDRWRAVVRAAAEQSGRVVLPTVSMPVSWLDLVPRMPNPSVIAWEESSTPLDAAIEALRALSPAQVTLAVGPEGGLTKDEASVAARAGAAVVSLGPRTLRSETAGVFLASLVLHALGAFSP